MNQEGFIKLHRSILSWDWADDSTVFYFFVRLIFAANYQEKQWHGMTIQRGQFITSIEKLCEMTRFSKPTIRRCISCLTQTGEIKETIIANRYRIITVVNYDKYQSVGKKFTDAEKRSGKNFSTTEKKFSTTGKNFSTTGKKVSTSGKKSTNSPTNSLTTTKELKKYSSPLREKNTADTSARPEGGGHVPPEPTSTDGLVPAKEMINFSNTVPGGQVFLVWEFRSGFEQSGTVMPPNWQELYERYVAAEESNRIEFLKRLSAGEYRERWGSF